MDMGSSQNTITFNLGNEHEIEVRRIMLEVYNALKEKGYNPINQIVGYILSEDPTYITTHNNARNLIRRVDRDTLLQLLVKVAFSLYLDPHGTLAVYKRADLVFIAHRIDRRTKSSGSKRCAFSGVR